jgi:hypothetical protein
MRIRCGFALLQKLCGTPAIVVIALFVGKRLFGKQVEKKESRRTFLVL